MEKAIVFDNGSHYTRVGIAGEDDPRAVFPSLVGSKLENNVMVGSSQKESYVGDEARFKRGVLHLQYPTPIAKGVIKNWDKMEQLWHHTFYNELRVAPAEQPVLLSEPLNNPKANREKITQIMFETFNVPGMYLANAQVLALLASGRTTGLVLDSGLEETRAVPVYQGHILPIGGLSMDIGGRDLTNYFTKLLQSHHNRSTERQLSCQIKEKVCEVSLCTSTVLSTASIEQYKMPDGSQLTLSTERFECPEALFTAGLIEGCTKTVQELCYESVMTQDDPQLITDLFQNIVVAGGNTRFWRFDKRLEKELWSLLPIGAASTIKPKVIAAPEHAAWIGGSVLASLPTFKKEWITKEQYDEAGPRIVRACLAC